MKTTQIYNSSLINKIGYDESTQELQITFNNGKRVDYTNVPKNVYNELMNSSSVGKYYNANIKRKY